MKIYCILAIAWMACTDASAAGRLRQGVNGTFRDEGNTGILFNVGVTTTAWTAVPSSTDSIRRAIIYQTSEYAQTTVCLSTTSAAGDVCDDTRPGVQISTGATLSDYSGIQFYGRGKALGGGASVTIRVFCYWTRDSGDFGAFNNPR